MRSGFCSGSEKKYIIIKTSPYYLYITYRICHYRQFENSEVLSIKNTTKNAPENDELAALTQHHFPGQRIIFSLSTSTNFLRPVEQVGYFETIRNFALHFYVINYIFFLSFRKGEADR